jgi:uncharacterized protein (DUF1501 family)
MTDLPDDPQEPFEDTLRAGRRAALSGLSALVAGAAFAGAPRGLRAQSAGLPERKLVVVMLRGAVDGLSVVVPHGDADYARNRAEIAIAAPGESGGALPLDTLFGLHPSLAPLMPSWAAGRLAFVHASGSTDRTRSHFDAQDYMETATPGRRATPDGWMNRLLAVLGEPGGVPGGEPVRGVNLGPSMPRILVGASQVASLPAASASGRAATVPSATLASALDRMYADDPAAATAWAALRDTRQAMAESVSDGMDQGIANGAVPLAGLVQEAGRLGRLMRREPSMRAAFFSVGGWDTHTNQGNARGRLAGSLGALAQGLDALVRGLDDRLDDTVVLVMSEFGRTVRQNGTQGTDHGHGNAMWLLGGGVQGGRVHGEWPGLDRAALHEGRDLAITTDFRAVIAQVLAHHMRLDDRQIARVLPQGAGTAGRSTLFAG